MKSASAPRSEHGDDLAEPSRSALSEHDGGADGKVLWSVQETEPDTHTSHMCVRAFIQRKKEGGGAWMDGVQ